MPDFFLVDRYGTCRSGGTLDLQAPHYAYAHPIVENLEVTAEVQTTLNTLFPGGLSTHGHRYMLERYSFNQNLVVVSPIIELVAELVRRAFFPDQPSRMQAFFASETLEIAQAFRARHAQPFHRIFRVTTKQYFRGDMALLLLGPTAASSINLLQKYWRGESSKNPVWEVVLHEPIQIVAQVDPAP